MHDLPQGFDLAAAQAGFRYRDRPDLALVFSRVPARAAGVFTTNTFQAAPVQVARANLEGSDLIQALLVNAGQANACTGVDGLADCRKSIEMLAGLLDISAGSILPASTGVIGVRMPMSCWEISLPGLVENLGKCTGEQAATAIMTTDTFPKTASREIELEGGRVRFWGMTKGAGMICPDMATMLAFVLTDTEINGPEWQAMLRQAAEQSFNAITVDGDTSTNDCVLALANGASAVGCRTRDDWNMAGKALYEVCRELAYQIVKDAEGGTKVMHIRVTGAANSLDARKAARAVGNSSLVKTAMFGTDPNWGRIVAALGRSGAGFDPANVRLSLAGREIFCNGGPVDMDVDEVFAPLLKSRDIRVDIDLGSGDGEYFLMASDLTPEYIRINSDYRS
ncbi:bifunctional glutamate N-acetyltransferase/amino-acid acetyltransferase ArgJ [Desulfonatronospira sp.]|uniref:bifunctional glutamate N-acetyltransferase/amino-acid acetyltransferase ArgJ n=1 Tax=Desulfonatronospira sp. TaxID=1962951 RepID=UPI0025C4622F|nr:bifunctional glutamate N-acetyltransferase/amino-acid acetyltransferase ArgJ [Desulfonatronospira sp.]